MGPRSHRESLCEQMDGLISFFSSHHAIRAEVDRHIRDKDRLAATCQDAQRQIEPLRAAVETERARGDAARADALELQEKRRNAEIARSTSEAAWKAERESLWAERRGLSSRAGSA